MYFSQSEKRAEQSIQIGKSIFERKFDIKETKVILNMNHILQTNTPHIAKRCYQLWCICLLLWISNYER